MLSGLNMRNKRLLSGANNSEDAGVVAFSGNHALVQTLDFISPVVDDAFIFGQIAAANALSDVFAMGAEVLSAMNILCCDKLHFKNEIFAAILEGGASKIAECGAVLAGGHSVSSSELFYGLSVTGVVHPKKFWANNTAKPGDILILTKPLGSGVLSTALKNGALGNKERNEMISQMCFLNKYAADALKGFKVHACTDITGFGLLGHMSEMLNEKIAIRLFSADVPLMNGAKKAAKMGFISGGTQNNKDTFSKNVDGDADILFYDAQTSGGLLIAVAQKDAKKALNALNDAGYKYACMIAEVVEKSQNESGILVF